MKKTIVVALLVLAVLSTAFCNGSTEAEATKEISTTIWTDSQSLEPGIVAAVNAFMAENPNYKIAVESFPGSERPEKLALSKESGTLPSLFLTAFFTSADEVHQGTILPVTDLVKGAFKGNLSEAALSTVQFGNDYYEIPLFTSSQGLLYNADMFRAAGLEKYVSKTANDIACWTLDDFDNVILPALKKYMAGTDKYVMTLYAANNQNDSYNHNLLKMYDGNIFTDGYVTAADDKNVVKALEKIAEWVKKGYTNSDVNTRLWTNCNADFRNQKCAISAGQFQSYLNHLVAFKNGSAKEFDARVAVVPCKSNGKDTGRMHMYTYGFALMNVDADQLKVARAFLTWLAKNTQYVPAMINGVPSLKNVLADMQGDNPIYAAYQDAEKYVFDFTGNAPGWVATRNVFYPELQATFSGAKTPAKALADYQKAANEIIKEYKENSVIFNK